MRCRRLVTATSAARRPICKAGYAPAPAPQLSSTPAALPKGAPRVRTQSLLRNAQTNAMRQCQVMALRGLALRGRVSRANCLSPCSFLGFFGFGHSLSTSIRSQECEIEIIIYVRERWRWVLKYKVEVNLLYPKIDEIDPYAMQQGSEFKG